MPEWTAEVIWWVCGAGGIGLLLGWLVGRFANSKVARPEYDRLLSQERSLRNELNDTKTRQASVDQELRELRTRNLTLVGEIDANERMIEEVRVQTVTDNVTAGEAHQVELTELHGINASLRDELEAARQRYAELHALHTQVTADLNATGVRLADLDRERAQHGADLELVAAEVTELRNTNTDIATRLSTATERVDHFERRTATASDDLYLVRARVSEVEGKLAGALKALRDASGDLTNVQDGFNAPTVITSTNGATPNAVVAGSVESVDAIADNAAAANIDLRTVDVTDAADHVDATTDAADADAFFGGATN